MSVVQFVPRAPPEEEKPHAYGTAICIDCKHEWMAVAPLETKWLECPQCSLIRGRFKYTYHKDHPHWECTCGNDLFCVTPQGYYCPNCSNWASGF